MLPDPMTSQRYAWPWPRRLARVASPGWLAPPLWLALLGALFLGISVIGLVLPYNLFTLQLRPYLNIANLTNGNRLAEACFVLTLAALAGLYYLAWRACRAAGLAAAGTGRQPRAMSRVQTFPPARTRCCSRLIACPDQRRPRSSR